MVKTGEGTFRWSYVFRLYRDWGALENVLLAFAIGRAVPGRPNGAGSATQGEDA